MSIIAEYWCKIPQNKISQPAIALICDHADPMAKVGDEEACGICIYARKVGETLAELGWKVDLFTRKVRVTDQVVTHIRQDCHCRLIRLTAGPVKFVPREDLFHYMPDFIDAFRQFQNENKQEYFLIHTNYWLAGWVGWQLKQENSNLQWIHTYHSLGITKAHYHSDGHFDEKLNIRLEIEKLILENADRVVATSKFEEQELKNFVSSSGRIEVIPCGTDTSNFHPISQKEARAKLANIGDSDLTFQPNDKLVLYVGRFDRRKGIETLVRACSKLTVCGDVDLRLLIVGGSNPTRKDGKERRRIEKIVEDVGLSEKTVFPGLVEHRELSLYYSSADVCVVPSDYEPFGLVSLEAMACGTPVIASAVGGLKDTVISESNGLLVPPKDINAFSEAIGKVLRDSQFARYLGENGIRHVQEYFDWTRIASKLELLYKNLLLHTSK